MDKLAEARKVIDRVDTEMSKLFEERMAAVRDVIAYKQEHGMEILDSGREREVIARGLARLENKELEDLYEEYLVNMMGLSKRYQSRILGRDRVGYQGVEGAFSHIAQKTLFPHARALQYPTFGSVFEAVSKGEIEYGVIPFENSYTGEVGEVLDLLYTHNCYITHVYDLRLDQNLLAHKGVDLAEVKEVYSHPQAIAQSKDYLEKHGLTAIPYANTALAAKYVSESGDRTKAAIASVETADIYGLEVLAASINTSSDNTTRFIVLSRTPGKVGTRFSLLFTVAHTAGQLANAIELFGSLGYNLENIKSRPIRNRSWEYYFYVEVVGDLDDQKADILMERLADTCREIKILGAYDRT